MEVLPAPVRVSSQRPLAPRVASVTSVATDKVILMGPYFFDESTPCMSIASHSLYGLVLEPSEVIQPYLALSNLSIRISRNSAERPLAPNKSRDFYYQRPIFGNNERLQNKIYSHKGS